MILAAGKGERMRPLTNTCPKPLLTVHDRTLIEHAIDRIKAANIRDIVINVSWLGEKIEQHLGDGSRHGVHIRYSREAGEPLETGAGIAKALPLLTDAGDQPFLLVNADVWCELPLVSLSRALLPGTLAHLVLVPNPAHHSKGDFVLDAKGSVQGLAANKLAYTYSGISVIHPQLFRRYAPAKEKFPLRDLLVQAIANDEVTGEIYNGVWVDVGTPERLVELNH